MASLGGPYQLSTDTVSLQFDAWVDEKMLMAQDVSYGEARGLHSKWQKHQAFMAELVPNQSWLEKIEAVGGGTMIGEGEWRNGVGEEFGA